MNNKTNRRCILGLSALTALGLVFMPGSAVSQQKSVKDQLVGTWTAVSWEQTNKDGSKLERFGSNPKGVNVFDADGRFFIMFARSELPKMASNNPSSSTPAEDKGIGGGSIAYFGTYTVNTAGRIVTLRVEASSLPDQVGAEQQLTVVSLTADELKYTITTALTGGAINVAMKRATAVAAN
jgi:hypothetical protein